MCANETVHLDFGSMRLQSIINPDPYQYLLILLLSYIETQNNDFFIIKTIK